MRVTQIFAMKAWRYVILLALLLVNSTYMFAQSVVSGIVTDGAGEPLIGVNVLEKGTTNGTITGVNGDFNLRIARGKTLVFSYIGYLTQEVTVNGTKLNITLKEDSKILDDVVVIGYGSMARKDVTSSITTVKAEQLNKGVFADAASMLQGKVAGLTVTTTGDPNGAPSMTLRGASSLRSGAMSPYYVIDGVPGVDISMVAPDDIESIDVLRDATATAIYGSKAANGVIIVTTKKGKKNQDRVNVSYSGYVAFDNILNTLDVCDANDLRSYAKANNLSLKDGGANVDWQKEVLRTGISHSNNLSINGGSEKTTYMASVSLIKREGVIKKTGNDRVNIRTLVSSKVLKDHLDISLGVNHMYGKGYGVPSGEKGASVLDAMNYFSPTNPLKNEDGTWSTGSGSKNYNPMSMIEEDTSETISKKNQFIGKATLNIIEGLNWNVNYSWENYQDTYSGYDTHFTQLEGVADKNGQASRNSYFGKSQTFETYGNYDNTFADKHKVAVMLGYSWEEKNLGDGFGVTVHDFYNDNLKWYNLTYASTIDGIPAVGSGVVQNVRNISFYGRASYSYNSKYMLQATIRRDGSSVFGKNNRWGTFPSVSVAWNITEEEWMKNQNTFDNLKLRMGYGVSGNAMGFDAYTAIATYGATGFFDYNGSMWRTLGATKNANPDLKWESTGMLNIGLDYGMFNGRLSGTLEFYNKKTKDLIWSYPVSTNKFPFGWIDANVGEITNTGVELSINAIPVQTKDFSWNTTLNLSHNKNTVNRLSNDKFEVGTFTQGDPDVAGVSSNGWTQRVIEGQPLGTFYTYEFAGFKDGASVYYVRDEKTGERTGEVTNSPEYKDRTITGCAQPKLNLGWNNTLNYKDWNLSAFITGVFGNDIYNSSRAHYTSAQMFSDGKNVLKEFLENPAGDATGSIPSDRYIENGSYVRLQSITLGYTFRKFNDWLQNVQVYATCNNVFTITGYKGLDPEVSLGGIDPGIEYRWSTYPHTRTFLIGAKINF